MTTNPWCSTNPPTLKTSPSREASFPAVWSPWKRRGRARGSAAERPEVAARGSVVSAAQASKEMEKPPRGGRRQLLASLIASKSWSDS